MFENLSEKLAKAFKVLKGQGTISEITNNERNSKGTSFS